MIVTVTRRRTLVHKRPANEENGLFRRAEDIIVGCAAAPLTSLEGFLHLLSGAVQAAAQIQMDDNIQQSNSASSVLVQCVYSVPFRATYTGSELFIIFIFYTN